MAAHRLTLPSRLFSPSPRFLPLPRFLPPPPLSPPIPPSQPAWAGHKEPGKNRPETGREEARRRVQSQGAEESQVTGEKGKPIRKNPHRSTTAPTPLALRHHPPREQQPHSDLLPWLHAHPAALPARGSSRGPPSPSPQQSSRPHVSHQVSGLLVTHLHEDGHPAIGHVVSQFGYEVSRPPRTPLVIAHFDPA